MDKFCEDSQGINEAMLDASLQVVLSRTLRREPHKA